MSHYKVQFIPDTPNHCWNKAFDLIQEKSEVLDIGCSTGDFGRALVEHKGCVVDGIEPDKGDARKAQKVLNNVHQGFAEDILDNELKNKKYDHIVFMDVIEHLYDPVKTLMSVRKHLKPGGTVVFSIPNMAHVSVRLMLLKGDFEYGNTGLLDNTHLHYYTRLEIDRVFKEAGLDVSTWDFTEATYPTELVVKELKKIGLTADNKALGLLTNDQAQIFQYVGAATVADGVKKTKRISYSPDPQGQISREYEARIAEIQSRLDEAYRVLKLTEDEVIDLKSKLTSEDYMALQVRLHKYAKNYVKKKLSR